MKKRIGSLLLILALCFTLLPTAAFAAENTQEPTEPQEPQETQDAKTWGDKADTSWYVGHEADTEYHIITAEQLAGLAKLVNADPGTTNFAGKTFYLEKDLDLSGHEWISIGTVLGGDYPEYSFCGVFDGQGHVISNLYSHESDIKGADETHNLLRNALFGSVHNGEVKNLGVADAEIWIDPKDDSAAGKGILVDWMGKSKITNCWTSGSICSDKTGTLTQNRMTVRKLYTGGEVIDAKDADFRDPLQEPLLRTALLCSDAVISGDTEIGDPTETALVRLGETNGFDEDLVRNRWPRLTEIPFDSDRKMMSTVHKLAGGLMLVTKGATDVLLDRCVVTPEERARIEQVNEQFSNEGLRVLAFACRSVDGPAITLADENSLTFLGLIAMMDPPREESKAAVAECIRAGIRPIMITGDHKITAAAIAREIGILRDGTEAVEGAVIDGMSDEELQEFVPKVSVYARVSPEHKIRIVRAWQQRGNLVAMTGDGVNDAPALKQADIGVAMGITGTEVAKDAAGMVLTDDNFATIVKAVKNGRNVYANIKRAIQFLLSGNTAGILTVLYASLMGLPVPFAAVHLLFINLLTDSLPAIALGMEPHTDEVMSEKPRPRNEGILTKHFLYSVGVEGLVIAAATVTAFYLGLNAGGAAAGQTMAFSTLCLSRLFHGFSCKSQHPVLLTRHFWNNRALLGAFTIGALLLGLVLLVPALEPLFAIAPLSVGMVGAIVGLAFGSMLVIQLLKWIRR